MPGNRVTKSKMTVTSPKICHRAASADADHRAAPQAAAETSRADGANARTSLHDEGHEDSDRMEHEIHDADEAITFFIRSRTARRQRRAEDWLTDQTMSPQTRNVPETAL